MITISTLVLLIYRKECFLFLSDSFQDKIFHLFYYKHVQNINLKQYHPPINITL